jgi:hypothetical protein
MPPDKLLPAVNRLPLLENFSHDVPDFAGAAKLSHTAPDFGGVQIDTMHHPAPSFFQYTPIPFSGEAYSLSISIVDVHIPIEKKQGNGDGVEHSPGRFF